MARYGKDHKQATRQRIIQAAGRRLKRDGIDGSGIATVMADAGLTNGAFYAHFESKEDLVARALVEQLREQGERFAALPPGRDGLERIVRAYLSVEHRDDPDGGCASAALLDEIGRSIGQTKSAYTEGLLVVIDDIAARLAPDDPRCTRTKTLERLRPDGRDAPSLPAPWPTAARRRRSSSRASSNALALLAPSNGAEAPDPQAGDP